MIFNSSNDVILLIFSSLTLRFLLQICGQKWIKTIAHTSTLVILPIITYIITSVISGNIALSLGMVGALSIVRFRNPVRSPLELTVYFTAITMGIATSVSLRWLLFLMFSLLISVFSLYILSYFSKIIFNKDLFILSFTEGNSISTLEVKSRNNLINFDNHKFLKSKYSSKELKTYILASNNFELLKQLCFDLDENHPSVEYQLNE